MTDAQLSEFVFQNEERAKAQYTEMGKVINSYVVTPLVFGVVAIICFFLVCFEHYLIAILVFNIPLFAEVLLGFLRIDQPAFEYIKIPLMKEQIDNLELFVKRNKIDFHLDIQICIKETNVAEENALPVLEPFIDDDIRVMVSQTEQDTPRPLSWLCAMFSFAMNDYRGNKKPYTYFIVVFDKSKLESSEATFIDGCHELQRKINNDCKNLMCEFKNETDNYVIVVRKSESVAIPYMTTEIELEQLVWAAKEIFSMESLR